MAPTAVEARNIVHRYDGTTALDDVSVTLAEGVVALVGPNGAGKTTLMKLVSTAIRVEEGSMSILGHDVTHRRSLRAIRRELGYLPQQFAYPARLSVREFVTYCAWLRDVPVRRRSLAVDGAIEAADLVDVRDRKLGQLSGGMLRRAGLAQAIVASPQLLVLDEPTAGLDPEQRIRFRLLLRRASETRTVLLSSHLIEDVGHTADRILVLRSGRMLFDGDVDALIAAGGVAAAGDSPLERGFSAVVRTDPAGAR